MNTTRLTRWAVGMTTAPRREPTLERTLQSLAEAGWDRPRLFAEPETRIPNKFASLPLTQRDAVLGAFPNWYLALAELVMREPRAEAYLLCQDDVLFAGGLRGYLEEHLWPAPRVGVVSVYCPSHYAVGQEQGFHVEDRGWLSWGALAYVFPNSSARALLCDPQVVGHRDRGPAGGLRNIDSVIGRWCRDAENPYFVHVPSLAQHIGATSTIWVRAGNSRRRRADRFLERIETTAAAEEFVAAPPAEVRPAAQPAVAEADTPLLAGQAWRFVKALTRHAADGLRKCTQEEVNHRLSICQLCPAFTGDRCRECGCRCNERKAFLNKLAWRSEGCPLGKW